MARNVAQQLIESHLVSGEMRPGAEIALSADQTLTQDATGTMVMLELEALGLDRVRTGVSVQYVDHNLLQADSKNADDHLFLRSACRRFGLWFSKRLPHQLSGRQIEMVLAGGRIPLAARDGRVSNPGGGGHSD
jgi:aconitate hydratase